MSSGYNRPKVVPYYSKGEKITNSSFLMGNLLETVQSMLVFAEALGMDMPGHQWG